MKKKQMIVSILIILMTALAYGQSQTFEAEDATLYNAVLETTHSGYSGRGYVNFDNVTGSYLEWSVNASSPCTATCTIDFANGGGSNRPMALSVNGSVAVANIDFPATGDWASWTRTSVVLSLSAGNNTIRITSTGSDGGPNIDLIEITFSGQGNPPGSPGDVNGDETVNIVDALMTAQYYVGLNPNPFNQGAADVNCDNSINIIDALMIAQHYVGLIGSFSPCYTPGPIITPTPVTTPTPNVTAPPGVKGYININDPVPGWASMSGGTTGGGTNLGSAVTVSSMSDLKSAASGSSQKIILVKPGTYNGSFEPGANKTIIGTAPGVTIQGKIYISGSDKKNIIVRNIAVRGDYCSSDDECRSGSDAVYIGNGAHHIWFDHCDVADGQDGNFDITKEGDYVTISWTKLWYTKVKPHAQCSLIAGSDGETQSRGKLQITYMNCWWGSFINARQPRGRFGKVHCLNNYHNSQGGIHGVGLEMSLIAENNYYDTPGQSIFKDMGSPKGWKGIGNEGSAKGMSDSRGSVFTIPYNYTAMPASQVKAAITASVGGAGTTVRLQM